MSIDLWPHQQRVFDLLMAGKNVILQSPTGSGKTQAALYPFLYSLDPSTPYHGRLPGRCIYCVPMRILARQFHLEWQKRVERYQRRYSLDRLAVNIQTGEASYDSQFTGNLIFATIDQALSSFLMAPYGLPRRLANLNAGAVMSSYLVFDEFHLFDPASMLPTTLEMLMLLKGVTPFVLMTATFSRDMLDGLAEKLDAEVVPAPGDPVQMQELLNLAPQQKTRRYHTAQQALSADAILEAHHSQGEIKRTLVICNTVDRARTLFERIRHAAAPDDEVRLLHSRFLPEDRRRIEDEVQARFGKQDTSGGSMIVVATQAIEVGLDISSRMLHTELAPANAIIQRAGRCARYQGEVGDVYVYRHVHDPQDEIIDLFENVMPYQGQDDLLQATFDALQAVSGQALNYTDEQAILSAVHGARDKATIDMLGMTQANHRGDMFAAMRGELAASSLVRNVLQQRVTIHANPDELLAAPYEAPSFGLHPGSVKGYLQGRRNPATEQYEGGWLDRADALELDWGVKYLHAFEDRDLDEDNAARYAWKNVPNVQTARGASLLVINPALATYDPVLGFLADRGGDWQAALSAGSNKSSKDWKPNNYHLETYARHIELVHQAFEALWPEAEWAAIRLEELNGWQAGSIKQAAELAVLLHDVGKLSKGWQGWVRRYQQRIGMPVKPGEAYAHTESQTEEHREAAGKTGPRPWHAVEGAVAIIPYLLAQYGEGNPLPLAIVTAIARHHTPFADENGTFELEGTAARHVAAVLNERASPTLFGLGRPVPSGRQKLLDPAHEWDAFQIYLLLVRALRRSDQQGTVVGSAE